MMGQWNGMFGFLGPLMFLGIAENLRIKKEA